MSFNRLKCALPALFLMAFVFAPNVSAQTLSAFFEGSLVRAQGDSKVYYIQNGQKRWVASESAFLAQGFRWSDVTVVDAARLSAYALGAEISGTLPLGLSVDQSLLPDLAPAAPYDLRIAVEEGRTRLRFTSTFINRGKGALELNADQSTNTDGNYDASQRIFRPDGSHTDTHVGILFWHDIHGHYHYDDFGRYVLEMVRPASGGALVPPVMTTKTTFCMRDDLSVGATMDGAKQPKKYGGCRGHQQGVSVGWADVYPYTLDDQYVDVTDLPAGTYTLSFLVDSANFIESRRDNNISSTIFDLDPAARTMTIRAVASAYDSPNNRYPDGMLIKSPTDPKVYVVRGGKKRWLRTEEAFLSYGNSWNSIYTLDDGAIKAIPDEKLIRTNGAIYVLNDAGYKRRILSPAVLDSYGWAQVPFPDINAAEFNSIPTSDLIRPEGSDRVYSISSRKFVGSLGSLLSLGSSLESVHAVNETDFNAYAVSTIATGLTIPWDIAFLPDGDLLVTERTGTVKRIGKHPATIAIPNVLTTGEGGLMGIVLHPNFAQNSFVYLYYTTDENGRSNRVTRFRLEGDSLIQDKIILKDIPSATYHDGGQLAFGPDGMLYIATGDAQKPDLAQDTKSIAGKILRVTAEGSIPSDNPFSNAVWSYGHRNPQGLAWDANGTLYETEHGPTGEFGLCCRDDLNRIVKGGNFGWPVITGTDVRQGMLSPLLNSGTDTWAPSGLAYFSGNLYFSGLRGSSLYRATLDGQGNVSNLTSFFKGTYGRLRAAEIGPDGFLYITTSNRDGRGTPGSGDDKIIKIAPDFF